jgi:hypothetical protein
MVQCSAHQLIHCLTRRLKTLLLVLELVLELERQISVSSNPQEDFSLSVGAHALLLGMWCL